jgi:hypothetical protein
MKYREFAMPAKILFATSSPPHLLLAKLLYIVGRVIGYPLAFLPTLTEAIERGTPAALVK